MRLTKATVDYSDAYTVHCTMHYHAARILISLLAPSAPAFAEECWVILHYGLQKGEGGGSVSRYQDLEEDGDVEDEDEDKEGEDEDNEGEDDADENNEHEFNPYQYQDAIDELVDEVEEDSDWHRLPRQGQPDTLESIFNRPFPVAHRDIFSATEKPSDVHAKIGTVA
jgi:leucyl-tRNA synthetase